MTLLRSRKYKRNGRIFKMQVIKRDGRITDFNEERIIKAITMAMASTTAGVDIDLATKITDSVKNQLKDKHIIISK